MEETAGEFHDDADLHRGGGKDPGNLEQDGGARDVGQGMPASGGGPIDDHGLVVVVLVEEDVAGMEIAVAKRARIIGQPGSVFKRAPFFVLTEAFGSFNSALKLFALGRQI